MKVYKDGFIMGLAIFSIFFGAGNLIFPPKLGVLTGNQYIYALLGYIATGVCLPIFALIALNKSGGSISHFAKNLGPNFTKLLAITVFLIIGPLVAIPRTAATTYEITFASFLPDYQNFYAAIPFSTAFFILALFFVFKADKVMESLGKFLTPILLCLLFYIIANGVFKVKLLPISTNFPKPFLEGFFKGYQTMDALAAIMLGGIIGIFLHKNGHHEEKNRKKVIYISIAIALILLTLIYGGLLVVGSKYSGLLPHNLGQVETLASITSYVLGNIGQVFLVFCVFCACLTTAIGLLSSASDYFSHLTNNKITYKQFAIIFAFISCIISVSGVETIVKFAGPVLGVIYPVVMVLIVANLLNRYIPNRGGFIGASLGAFIVSLSEALNINLVTNLPLQSVGLGWMLPALLMGILGLIVFRNSGKES